MTFGVQDLRTKLLTGSESGKWIKCVAGMGEISFVGVLGTSQLLSRAVKQVIPFMPLVLQIA